MKAGFSGFKNREGQAELLAEPDRLLRWIGFHSGDLWNFTKPRSAISAITVSRSGTSPAFMAECGLFFQVQYPNAFGSPGAFICLTVPEPPVTQPHQKYNRNGSSHKPNNHAQWGRHPALGGFINRHCRENPQRGIGRVVRFTDIFKMKRKHFSPTDRAKGPLIGSRLRVDSGHRDTTRFRQHLTGLRRKQDKNLQRRDRIRRVPVISECPKITIRISNRR